MVIMKLLLLSLVPLFIPLILAETFGKCFWPNGKKAPSDYVQCPGQTNCCKVGEACLSNDLCYGARINAAYRGACADQDWPTSCSKVCKKEVTDTWANIYACPNNTNNVFTCGRPGLWATEICNDDVATYAWDERQIYNVSEAAVPDPSIQTTTASSSMTPTTSTSDSLSSQSAGTCTSAADSSHEKTALAAGLGAGLGAPLFLVSAAFLIFGLHTRKQLQQERAKSQEYLNALHSAQQGTGGVPYSGGPYGPQPGLSNKSTVAGELEGSDMRARELEG